MKIHDSGIVEFEDGEIDSHVNDFVNILIDNMEEFMKVVDESEVGATFISVLHAVNVIASMFNLVSAKNYGAAILFTKILVDSYTVMYETITEPVCDELLKSIEALCERIRSKKMRIFDGETLNDFKRMQTQWAKGAKKDSEEGKSDDSET